MLNVEKKMELFGLVTKKKAIQAAIEFLNVEHEAIFWEEGKQEEVKALEEEIAIHRKAVEEILELTSAIVSVLPHPERWALKKEYNAMIEGQ